MEASDIRNFDGRLLPAKMTMTPIEEPGNQTILEYNTMTFNEPIRDSFFSIQNMKRVN